MIQMPCRALASLSFWVIALTAWVFLALGTVSSQAATWQWSVEDGNSRAFLWIPPECREVRAIVLANHNMIEQGILEHPEMRRELSRLAIAEVWVVPGMDIRFDFEQGAGERFQGLMDKLALRSGYGELATAPVVTLGHSANATWVWNFAAWNPGRTLAVLSVHGDAPQTKLTGYGGANVDWGDRRMDGVPGLMVMAEYEWWEDRLSPAFTFQEKYPGTPLAFLGDAGNGHFNYSDELVRYLALFIRKAAERRLPPEHSGTLRPVAPETGWRMDRWRKDAPPIAPAAPYADYRGKAGESFWCFDEEMARVTETYYAAARGKMPQLVAVSDGQSDLVKGCGEPVTPRFLPAEDGVSFRLETGFMDRVPLDNSKALFWTGLAAGAPLGHATEGGPIVLSRIVGPFVQKGPNSFAYHPGPAEYDPGARKSLEMWFVARHPGDARYKSAVQQAMVKVIPNREGAPQRINFPAIPDQTADTLTLKLEASSDAGLPVSYFIRQGPGEVVGDTLRLGPIPPRASFPMEVTVVAWQLGRAADPKVQTAERVERTFRLLAPKTRRQ